MSPSSVPWAECSFVAGVQEDTVQIKSSEMNPGVL